MTAAPLLEPFPHIDKHTGLLSDPNIVSDLQRLSDSLSDLRGAERG